MKPVTIYTTEYCSFCARAKKLLAERQIPFTEVPVDDDAEKRAWLVENTGQRTVPQIFIGVESIGGYTELHGLDASGALSQKLSG